MEESELPYLEADGCLCWRRPVRGGNVLTRLTNFSARIVAQVVRDDGAETQRLFEIEAVLRGRPARFLLSASGFLRMDWPAEHLGAGAVVAPGIGLRDQARVAIQELSGPHIPERRVFAHLGWRLVGEQWIYLHAGGGIGPRGPVDGIEVGLPRELADYRLTASSDADGLRTAVRASLRLLEVAPDTVSVPLLCAIYRAPLGESDFTLHATGDSGLFKTAACVLAQAHWGAAFTDRHVPASWLGTGNALEALAFAAKDALFLIDDFVPRGSAADVARTNRDAERVVRAQGNRAGKQRMRADTTLRPPRPPRGLILSTGEDTPGRGSGRARLLAVEFRRGDVDVATLTASQADAAAGLYATAMAGYVQWLAGRYAEVSGALPGEVRELRAEATRDGMHPRTPDISANLALGLRYFLTFAQAVGAASASEAETLWQRGWAALCAVAAAQAGHIEAAEPTGLFLRLLSAAISSGRAHVEAADGGMPASPQAWGWREERDDWQSQGSLVGWLDGEHLYLQPEASFAAAQAMGKATGDEITVTQYTLRKRLHDRGLLASVDTARGKLTVRRTLGGTRHEVLHLRVGSLAGDDADGCAAPVTDPGSGPVPGVGSGVAPADRPTADSPEKAQDGRGGGSGPIGPVGTVSRAEETPNDAGRACPAPGETDGAGWRPCCIYHHPRLWRDRYGVLKCAMCFRPLSDEAVVEWVVRDDCAAAEQAGETGD
jgi:hypothetical protein